MRWFATLALVLLALSAFVPTGQAQADASITIVAYDSASDCPGQKDYCYEVTSGSLEDLGPGMSFEVTFRNEGAIEHELAYTALAHADPDRQNTDEGDALNEIEPIGPDQEKTKTFQIPSDANGVYFWCDISGHESLGMWLAHDFADGGDDGEPDGDDTQNGSPLPATALLVALIGAALIARQRDA